MTSFTLCRPMVCSIKFDEVKSGWSIVFIECHRLPLKNEDSTDSDCGTLKPFEGHW